MQQKWIDEGGIYFPIDGEFVIHATPGPGIWRIQKSSKPMDPRIGLAKVSDKFVFPYKIYPLGQDHVFNRIKALWDNKEFEESGKNLGVIFNGTKGTGKTVAAKLLCNELDLPVIIVSDTFEGAILPFIQNLSFECVILLDEAEKTFSKDAEDDKILLSLIDGVYNNSRKLYILTTNRLTVNENLIGRPGRIRYIQEFRNLPVEAIKEYCADNLRDMSKLDTVLQEIDLLEISTIDILKAIVEEINIFGEISDSIQLNIPKANYVFDILRLSGCTKDDYELIEKLVSLTNPENKPLIEWVNTSVPLSVLPSDLLKIAMSDSDFRECIELVTRNVDEDLEVPVAVVKPSIGPVFEGKATAAKVVMEGEGPVKSKKKSRKKPKTEEIEVIGVKTILRSIIPNCNWTSVYRMTCNFKELWKDFDTSLGIVAESPNKLGLFILQDNYDRTETVNLLLQQRSNPSLYRGGLVF